MAGDDPCAAIRKHYNDALDELEDASNAVSKANATEVTPLQTEINKIKLQIDGLKKNGDPEGRMPDLEALHAKRTKRLDEAKEQTAVKNASAWFNNAKAFVSETGSKLRNCEEEHETPSSPEPDTPATEPTGNPRSSGDSTTPPASAGPDAPTNDSAREHHPGECWCGTTHPDHVWYGRPCWCGKEGVHNVGTGRP
jgi:hypothetical protein